VSLGVSRCVSERARLVRAVARGLHNLIYVFCGNENVSGGCFYVQRH
jgi:hypothetical protein